MSQLPPYIAAWAATQPGSDGGEPTNPQPRNRFPWHEIFLCCLITLFACLISYVVIFK